MPFIDRFAIPYGADVQDHIADALEQFAFLLLLETPDAHASDWVFLEIDYALSHTMGILIVQWPGDPEPLPRERGDPPHQARSIRADDRIDHGYDTLTDPALDRVLHEVEAAHARVASCAVVECSSVSVGDAASVSHATSVALRDWTLDIDGPNGRTIVAITPRLPSAEDLRRLDEARGAIDGEADALLVHATRRLRETDRDHLTWVTGERRLALLPENAIGGHW